MAYPNWVFSMFSFIGFLLVTIPLPWHLEAWNTGTCLYMIWTGLACLNQFINSVVWTGNAINHAPVWCDISARFIIGSGIAIPCASLCINRRLYQIASVRSVTQTRAEKRRAIFVDLAIGIGIPILIMILQYIPQGHRFNIFEDVGCYPFTYNTWVGIVVTSVPPIIIGLVSAGYSMMTIKAFYRSRLQFKQILSSNSNLNTNRYIRLMCLAGTDILFTIPLCTWSLYNNISLGVRPWISWEDTHLGFSRVDLVPALLWRSDPLLERSFELTRWAVVFCAFLFFAFFGFADEARKNYRSAVQSVAKRVGISTSFSSTSTFSSSKPGMSVTGGTLPIFVHHETLKKKDSIGSFSDASLSLNDAGGLLNDEKSGDNEKAVMPDLSYNHLTIPDVSGILADYKNGPYSPTPSSGSSSVSSFSSPGVVAIPLAPEAAHVRPVSGIEISSLRRPSYPDSFIIPEVSMQVPRHTADTPSSVPRNSIDIV